MIGGILLAAGESTRMGQLKALLPWRGTTLFQSQIAELQSAGLRPIVVVLGHRSGELSPLASEQTQVVINEHYRLGRATSVIAGLSTLASDVEGVVITSVDQPTDAGIIETLVEAHAQLEAAVVLPSIHHRRGHPGLFDRRLFPEMLAITEEHEGLREVMTRHEAEICYVNVDTELVRTNLNSPAEYEAAYARWGQAPDQ